MPNRLATIKLSKLELETVMKAISFLNYARSVFKTTKPVELTPSFLKYLEQKLRNEYKEQFIQGS